MKPISRKTSSSSIIARLFVLVFALAFCFIGTLVFYFVTIKPSLKLWAAQSWTPLTCTVVESEVRTSFDSDGDTYSPQISYRYSFQGREYKSGVYDFFNISSGNRSGSAEIVAKFPKGKEFTCYVDPKNPEQAVIVSGLSWSVLFGLFPLLFVAIGLLILRFGFFHSSQSSDNPMKTLNLSPTEHRGYAPWKPDFVAPSDGVIIRSNHGKKFLGMVFVSVFWNGIVSVFIYQAYESWGHGKVDWFLTAFLVPFVLVGLALLVGIFTTFLALFNPRLILSLHPTQTPLGGKVEMHWKILGRAERISCLRFFLIGTEVATYQVGTDTSTASNEFFRKEIFNSLVPSQISQGQTSFTIPIDTMHSFHGANNKIHWQIKARAEIPRWPDIEESGGFNVIAP